MNARERFRVSTSKSLALESVPTEEKVLSSGDKEKDQTRLDALAIEIATLQDVFYAERDRKLLIILQGMDTAGKDSTVKHVFGRIDPQGVRSVPFRAPSIDESEHDFLWRVHAQVPRKGEIVLFNRSHYEDVLVPYVHGQIDRKEHSRRLAHIRNFEKLLTESGTVILKFFLHLSSEEQKKRLQARLDNPLKHWKFDPRDLAERMLWRDYMKAYSDAIEATDADSAPWYVIPADAKTARNLAVASIVAETLRDLKLAYPPGNPDYAHLSVE